MSGTFFDELCLENNENNKDSQLLLKIATHNFIASPSHLRINSSTHHALMISVIFISRDILSRSASANLS